MAVIIVTHMIRIQMAVGVTIAIIATLVKKMIKII